MVGASGLSAPGALYSGMQMGGRPAMQLGATGTKLMSAATKTAALFAPQPLNGQSLPSSYMMSSQQQQLQNTHFPSQFQQLQQQQQQQHHLLLQQQQLHQQQLMAAGQQGLAPQPPSQPSPALFVQLPDTQSSPQGSPHTVTEEPLNARTAGSGRTNGRQNGVATSTPSARLSPAPGASPVSGTTTKTSRRASKATIAVTGLTSPASHERTVERSERHGNANGTKSAESSTRESVMESTMLRQRMHIISLRSASNSVVLILHSVSPYFRKRLQRKAELARASRRRKKMYVGDLEGKTAALAAQNSFLLALINRRPDLLAAALEMKLPVGLVNQAGQLRSTVDLSKSKSRDNGGGDEGSDDEGDGDDGSRESDPEELSDTPPTAASTPAASRSSKRSIGGAARAQASPSLAQQHQPMQYQPTPAAQQADLSALVQASLPQPATAVNSMLHQLTPHQMAHLFPEGHPHHQLVYASAPPSMLSQTTAHMPNQITSPTFQLQSHSGSAFLTHIHPSIMPMTQSMLQDTPITNGISARPMHDISAMSAASPVSAAAPVAPLSSVHFIKALYHGEWRRFSMSVSDFTFARLLQTLQQLLLPSGAAPTDVSSASSALAKLSLQYVDAEGDAIELKSTIDLQEALRTTQAHMVASVQSGVSNGDAATLKLVVTDAGSTANISAATLEHSPVTGLKRKADFGSEESKQPENNPKENAEWGVKVEEAIKHEPSAGDASEAASKRARTAPQSTQTSSTAAS
jgi:hypothetical protein